MAALIPAIGTCISRLTGSERRQAFRLEQKLDDDWLLWFQEEADYIAKHLTEAHKPGTPWSGMAMIYRDYSIGNPVFATPRKVGIPVTYQEDITFAEKENTVKFLTIDSCKGQEFPLVAMTRAPPELIVAARGLI